MKVSSCLILDGAKRRAYATSTHITRDHPLQEIIHYKRSPITREKNKHKRKKQSKEKSPLQEKNHYRRKIQIHENSHYSIFGESDVALYGEDRNSLSVMGDLL